MKVRFSVGDLVSHKTHGIGMIEKIDRRTHDGLGLSVWFNGKGHGKSGTKAWLSKKDVELVEAAL